MPDAPIYRVGPQPGGPLFVPDTPNNREELRAREPSKYLNRRSYGERPAKEASDHSKKLEKKTDRAKASIVEAVHVPVHLAPPESLQTKQAMPPSCSTLTGVELPQAKKSCVYACRVTLVVSDSLRPCGLWPARLICQRGGGSLPSQQV